jgi:hypothetical protein
MQEKKILLQGLCALAFLGNQISLGWICYEGRFFGFPNKNAWTI